MWAKIDARFVEQTNKTLIEGCCPREGPNVPDF